MFSCSNVRLFGCFNPASPFTAMIEGIRQTAIDTGIIDPAEIDKGIKDLNRTTRNVEFNK